MTSSKCGDLQTSHVAFLFTHVYVNNTGLCANRECERCNRFYLGSESGENLCQWHPGVSQ